MVRIQVVYANELIKRYGTAYLQKWHLLQKLPTKSMCIIFAINTVR